MALYGSIADLDIEAISQTHSDSAVGLFIYDTRKDTDGGAWRKRTQHTSWYNETLNTSIRGSRKEFPAVAVIVRTSSKLIIYDGDHPDIPMWMEFDTNNTGGSWSGDITTANYDMVTGGGAKKGIAMMNGVLVMGGATSVNTVNFISERSEYRGATSNTDGVYRGTIAERNDNKGHKPEQNLGLLANAVCDDVAMTVLPNAPVDPGSGLPRPTIACATPSGLTIIKDDGTGTFNITASAGSAYNGVSFVNISDQHYLIFEQDSDTNSRSIFYIPIPTAARTTETNDGNITDKVILKFYPNGAHTPYPTINGGGVLEAIPMEGHNQAFRSNVGDGGAGYSKTNMLTLLETDNVDKEQGRVAYITSDHNTGWMTGNNILCVLSDTDDTNISASEKVTNHDFSNGTTGWTLADGNEGSISVSSGQLTLTNSTSADPPVNCYQALSLTAGKYYALESDHASGLLVAVNIVDQPASNGGSDGYGNVTYHDSAGTKRRVVFRATSQTNYVVIRVNTNATGTAVMNSVSITEAEPDRGPWGKFERDRMSGVKAYGNITKTAGATGADLVSYNNFNASNYFAQYMDQTIGTGDFSFSVWVMPPSSPNGYFHVISIGTESAGGQSSGTGVVLKLNASDSSPYFYTNAGGSSQGTYNSINQFSPNAWNHFVGGRSGGRFYMYLNGKLSTTGNVNSFNISDSYLTIGRGINHNEYDTQTKLALIRISKTFPDADHIAKMYEDEKALFQENAKATLYGTSDAVTAFAYDSTTKLLHAGTSAGRSVFQGLRRIDNTTTAVGARISASNSMVAED